MSPITLSFNKSVSDDKKVDWRKLMSSTYRGNSLHSNRRVPERLLLGRERIEAVFSQVYSQKKSDRKQVARRPVLNVETNSLLRGSANDELSGAHVYGGWGGFVFLPPLAQDCSQMLGVLRCGKDCRGVKGGFQSGDLILSDADISFQLCMLERPCSKLSRSDAILSIDTPEEVQKKIDFWLKKTLNS